MKAAFLTKPKTIEIREIPTPQPAPGQVLVRVRSVGICGSDIHYYEEGRIGESVAAEPHIMGHEFAGEIAALGAEIKGLRVGQKVAVEPAISCGACEMCREGHPNLCLNIRFMSVPPDQGALVEFILAEPERCFPLPDSLSTDDGAMLEPLGVALHTMRLAKMLVGDTVAIVGCGCIGLFDLQLALASGAVQVMVTDKLSHRLDFAQRLGATTTVNVEEEDPAVVANAVTGGQGFDLVIEAAGNADAPEQAMRLARNGGKVMLSGIPDGNQFTLTASTARRKGLTIKMVRRMKHTYPRAIALAEVGKVALSSMVTHRFPLEKVNEAFDTVAGYKDGVIKAMIEF